MVDRNGIDVSYSEPPIYACLPGTAISYIMQNDSKQNNSLIIFISLVSNKFINNLSIIYMRQSPSCFVWLSSERASVSILLVRTEKVKDICQNAENVFSRVALMHWQNDMFRYNCLKTQSVYAEAKPIKVLMHDADAAIWAPVIWKSLYLPWFFIIKCDKHRHT